jgi:hypothetical protein
MADVASKQQTRAMFLSTIVTRTRRHTELTKLTILMGILCCTRKRSVQFSVHYFYTVKLQSLTKTVWGHLKSQMSMSWTSGRWTSV